MVVVQLFYLESKFHIETRTVKIGISDPSSFHQSFLQIIISSSNNEDFLSLFKSIFLFPFSQISNMRKTSHFSLFLFGRIFLIFLALILVLVFIDTLLHSFLSFFIKLIIINSIQYVLFHCSHHILFELLF